ncbi:glycoside hydrolase family 19 protein [Paraburkholderia sp. HP33-1]|uniref:glycoside hydrolase family 19 protein n=1 Tax=Paraburkholderia sp. HP33-1 TaxID=2883243 RepID=UPI001F2177B8|nr:hypothetical protein [Paraburkholderia sp. HP33-1]
MANTTSSPNTATPPLKQIAFAFPFRKKGNGSGASATDITDEHEMHLLLKQEPSGTFAVSGKGMWHGGIHISEAGAGRSLDLKGGVRCLADGEVVAWRLDRSYPVSTLPARNGQAETRAAYSTGFALVQHTMEFPRGTTLIFYSLYMHLQDFAGYQADPALPWPGYWSASMQVTEDTIDRPTAGINGQPAPAEQVGLRVRTTRPNGTPVGILPRGTQVTLSRQEGDWGQIADDPGALYPPAAGGFVSSHAAKGKWIFLGKEHGHSGPVVQKVMPDSAFDCVNVVPQAQRIKVKAGDVIGYLGRYDSLRAATSNRLVHIEVFCDESIRQFIDAGRNWVRSNGANPNQWNQLGLPSDPTILRIQEGTTLFHDHGQQGQDAKKTDVIQVETFAALQGVTGNPWPETAPGSDGHKRNWWKVDSADMQRNAITGWVREDSFAGGRVTREHSQSWIDFKLHDEDHDPTHTIFATTASYVDYETGTGDPSAGSVGKLSPLMSALYRALYPNGDSAHAVEELSNIAQNPQGSVFPWVAFRASRLIPKHESEWANPAKWQELVSAIEERTAQQPEHEEEKKRIAKLVWWEDVQAGVPGFPGPDVFHIHPVALVGNFWISSDLITLEMLSAVDPNGSMDYHRQILPYLNKYAKGYAVTTPRRIAHFLSQVAVESQFKNIEEQLDYSAKRMKEVYGCKSPPHGNHTARSHIANGDVVCNFGQLRPALWTNTSHYAHNPENLANYVYAGRYQNGSEESGDGYKYRGRGLIQTTFKSNYEVFNREHNNRFPEDQRNFIDNPDLLLSYLEYGVESAFVYWAVTRSVSPVADSGDVAAVTQQINGGQNGHAERLAAYNKISPLLGLAQESN